ncbi:unnamed protein product [Linum trigynum]|uniref:Uncharacterized protein n=1 Tax=Linum trigynum TaxID=586398 RepID=A0AAV2CRE3_9ROSI
MIYCTNGWNVVGGNSKSKSNQYASTSLIQIEGVNTKKKVNWYQGKHLAYVYEAKSNLPPKSMGDKVIVSMYPCNI